MIGLAGVGGAVTQCSGDDRLSLCEAPSELTKARWESDKCFETEVTLRSVHIAQNQSRRAVLCGKTDTVCFDPNG